MDRQLLGQFDFGRQGRSVDRESGCFFRRSCPTSKVELPLIDTGFTFGLTQGQALPIVSRSYRTRYCWLDGQTRGDAMALRSTILVGLIGLLSNVLGCLQPFTVLEVDEERTDSVLAEVRTIGDITGISNAEPIPVSGVGLVVDLEGTGGSAPPGGFRSMLEAHLHKLKVGNVKELLSSKDASMVLVSGMIPPGANKNDPIDVEITLPPNSTTTSLRGGYLLETSLKAYDNTRNLDPTYQGPSRTLEGHTLVVAKGQLLVGMGDGDESAKVKQGRIWSGGRCLIDRPFILALNPDQQRAQLAMRVAERFNETFVGNFRGPMTDMASAKNNQVIYVRVPPQYKHNTPRFLRVTRLIPFDPQPEQGDYQRRLEELLLDSDHCMSAALRLEALGKRSIDSLKRGLDSDHVLVRFAAAESLAYLGSPSCGQELARIAVQQPTLRAYALTALASLDEAIAHVKLRELLASGTPEVRYGAFRALRSKDEKDPLVTGELLNDSFWLHRLAPKSQPLVHLSTSRRAEVILFGDELELVPPCSLRVGEFTVNADPVNERCTVSRMSVHHGIHRRQCSRGLEEVLRTMADLGATYPDVVEFVDKAGKFRAVNSRVAVDALPQITDVADLAKSARTDPGMFDEDDAILTATTQLSDAPNLFANSKQRSRRVSEEDERTLSETKPGKGERKTARNRR